MTEPQATSERKAGASRIDNLYFYDPELFPHLNVLRENRHIIVEELQRARLTKVIRPEQENGAELSGSWCNDQIFDDFYNRTKDEQGWLHWWSVDTPDIPNQDWTIFGLMHGGKYMTENCKLCPRTTELLERVPNIRVAGFSRLVPHSGIDTHKGFTGRRYGALAFHLGLVIPSEGCCLKCGPEVFNWSKAGDVLVFDDTFPHSAWNESGEERIILYIDFKIPEETLELLGPAPCVYSDSEEEDEDEDDDDDDDDDTKRGLATLELFQAFVRHSKNALANKERMEAEARVKLQQDKANEEEEDEHPAKRE
ncbi:Lipid A hydroxylase LpxO [Balamuthia mandrillaris]